MKREALKHPKTFDLAARLGCELPAAIGYLTLLFDFTGSAATQGDVGKWDDAAIARACEWRAEPAQFVRALVESRWLDVCKVHRLIVHDWHEHHEDFVRKRLERSGLECFRPVRTSGRRRADDGGLTAASRAHAPVGLAGQGSAGIGCEGGPGETTGEFNKFWQSYPRKEGKKAAAKLWELAVRGLTLEKGDRDKAVAFIQDRVEAFAASPKAKGQYCPHPATWLSQGRYDDDPAEWQKTGEAKNGKSQSTRDGAGQSYQGPPQPDAPRRHAN